MTTRNFGEHVCEWWWRSCLAALLWLFPSTERAGGTFQDWQIHIANDNCPDYTWGLTEAQTRQAFAGIVRAHLDEMRRTDGEPPENRDHYTMAVAMEALAFVERYPERKPELIQRIREGRVLVSPFLCNTLWGFQSVEGALRACYPARRLEQEWGLPVTTNAHHIELPSLPWGMVGVLAGCGLRWVSVPFLDYDCTFKELKNPPLFWFEGPDGSRVGAILDRYASLAGGYWQGAHILKNPSQITNAWLPNYAALGKNYPLRVAFASGTHSDISPASGQQARGFAEGITRYNHSPGAHPQLRNSTLAQFCQVVDQAENQAPFLPVVRGCFGHSWELWPVSLAKYAADLREGERRFLAAESLLAAAGLSQTKPVRDTLPLRQKAEWYWAMLADHAWNGTDATNQKENARLRREWSEGLIQLSRQLTAQAWQILGLRAEDHSITIFNSLGFTGDYLVVCPSDDASAVQTQDGESIPAQVIEEGGKRCLAFVAARVPAFGFREFRLYTPLIPPAPTTAKPVFQATAESLAGPFYRLKVDPRTGGLGSLVHQASGQELVQSGQNRTLCQTVYFEGRELPLTNAQSRLMDQGPVQARLRITGSLGDLRVTNTVTLYALLDRVDFDVQIEKPVSTGLQRLCQVFPVTDGPRDLRLETPGAILRPRPQPDGDLLPGADPRRFAVQGFVDVSPPDRPGVTIASMDAFAVRLDLDPITFEALGNDQNYKEVKRDQDGITHFRFRYSLQAHASGFNSATVINWSRSVLAAPAVIPGRLSPPMNQPVGLTFDSSRVMAACLKPVDGPFHGDVLLRLWEIRGESGPVTLSVPGFAKAIQTDLLERDLRELPVINGQVTLPMAARGWRAVRLFKAL